MGDLHTAMCELLATTAAAGMPVFCFSKKPEMIKYLKVLRDSLCVPVSDIFAIGSIDPSSSKRRTSELIKATAELNGKPTLAYATETTLIEGVQQEIKSHWAQEHFHVLFGYHDTCHKTVLNVTNECPATAGLDIKCAECRRCYGFDMEMEEVKRRFR